jgi:co-chaperonin GroES (HSP10)
VRPVELKVGDRVLIGQWAGDEVGEDLRLVRETDILGTLE